MIYTRELDSKEAGRRPAVVYHDVSEEYESHSGNEWWLSYLDIVILVVVLSGILVLFNTETSEQDLTIASQHVEEIKVLSIDDVMGLPEDSANQALHWLNQLENLIKEHALSQQVSVQTQMSMKDEEQGVLISFTSGVLFSDDRVSLSRAGRALLDELSPALKGMSATLYIYGHNDAGEGLAKEFSSKQELAEERAIDVLDYFARKGIPDARMKVEPYQKDSVYQLQSNTRVSVLLTSN